MHADPDPVHDEEFTARLLACDEALATGKVPTSLEEDAPSELRTRLLRGLACVHALQQLRPQRSAPLEDGAFPTRIGRFEIRCLLGRGGFGIVYRAYDPVLCREVALKIPRAEALVDIACQARFEREARAAAGLNHPNLVPVHEAGQFGPISYIAFAYCPGHDLATWFKERTTPIRCVAAARLVLTLARAIHYAHGRGILHRDLKPSNILLSPVERSRTPPSDNLWLPEADSALIPRVTDFGLAKFAAGDQAQTKSGDFLGTPVYMAPEQMEGRFGPVGPGADVYSLGVILYEVVTGRPPFWGESAVATLLQVKTLEPVWPSRLRPELPRDLETICLKCLHKEPRKRYLSAEALAEDLDRFLTGRPIQARPTSRAEQVTKWARRHPALAASLSALLLVTFLGTSLILEQWRETQDALAEEAHARREAVWRREQAQQAQQAEAREREKKEVALYHHGVVLAHHEWLAGNVGRSRTLLEAARVDLRNWEWRYVRRLVDSSVFTCAGHSTQVTSVAYSSDGRQLASAAGQWQTNKPGEVKLWDAATGVLLWTGWGHTGPVMSVAFSPDGSRLASVSATWGGKTNEIMIWETTTGKPVTTIADIPAGIFSVTYSPDGSRLATAGADGRVRLWDAASGRQLFALEGHKAAVFSVAFSPDGRQLASAAWNGTAIVWDLATRRAALPTLRGPRDLRSVAFSPDGQYLVTASFDHSVKIWEAASGQLLRPYWGHRAPVLCATFAPDGRRIASTDSAGVVHIWDAQTGRLFRTIRGHTGHVFGAAFSPDGRRLATAGRERTVRVWDITREQEAYSLSRGVGAQNVVFSPKGRYLAASGYAQSSGQMEQRVRVWTMDDPAEPRYWKGHTAWLCCVAFSPDEKLLASGSADRTVRLWDVVTEQPLCELKSHKDQVMGVAFNHDGTLLASASLDKTVQLWDVASKQPHGPALAHPHPVHDLVFSPDGKRLVAVGHDGMAFVWDALAPALLFALPGHTDIVERAVFSPDGRRLVTAGSDKTIRIWDMTSDPAAAKVAVPLYTLVGHTARVIGLCFSADGRRLASASGDQTIRLWDVDSGEETLTLRGHPDTICGVAFSPDGRLLISGSTRDIKVWDAGAGKAVRINPARAEREARAWHEQEAQACRSAEPPQWQGVLFHLRRLADRQPEDWRLLSLRAKAELELGQWRPAADDATRSIVLGATNYAVWFHKALACLQLDDRDGYRSACASMLERFGSEKRTGSAPQRAAEANGTAWTCVLTPAAVADLDRVVRLAESAVCARPGNGCYRNTLGAALYRAGRFQAALDMLRKQQDGPDDWLFLAMAHHRLGHAAEARDWLDKATHWQSEARRGQRAAGAAGGVSRSQQTQIEILHQEAATLLASKVTR